MDSSESSTPAIARRMACWFYEGMLLFGLVFIAGYLFGTLTQTRHALNNRHGLQVFLFLVISAYFVEFWSRGQTLAMKTWHIRIVDAAGLPISRNRALLRYLLSWVWILPPLFVSWAASLPPGATALVLLIWVGAWAGSSLVAPGRQFWHDLGAGTRLVHHALPEPGLTTR